MSDRDQIVDHLKGLHMPTMRRSYEEMADQAQIGRASCRERV